LPPIAGHVAALKFALLFGLSTALVGCAPRVALVAPPSGFPSWAREAVPDSARRVTLFYATDRRATGRSLPRRFYGEAWGELGFGTCVVEVSAHRSGLFSGLGRWFRAAGAPVKGVRLATIEPLDRGPFLQALRAELDHSPGRRVAIFVHGFNVPFERAARYAAQIARDVGLEGPVLLYSWPAPSSYLASEENVSATELHFAPFLERLSSELGAERLQILTFSMGSRAVVRSLERLASRGVLGDRARLDQVVLIAPDLDARWFARVVPVVVHAAGRVTLYASSGDKALRASRALHGHARAGSGGKARLVGKGFDTIDASRARAEIVGHGYMDELARDLRAVLTNGRPPEERPWLEPVAAPGGTWWRLKRIR
jgi:esterase/lipase superfamily enzyme